MAVKKSKAEKKVNLIKRFRPWVLLVTAIVLLGLLYKSKITSVQGQETNIVQQSAFTKTVKADGKIVAGKRVTLNFATPGKVSYIGIEKGDSVQRFQRLAGLDSHSLLTAARVAQRQLEAAEANTDEVEDTVQGHDSDESFAQRNLRTAAQSARDIAYDKWIDARRSVGDMSLYAPFNGIVTETSITSVGDTVALTDGITIIDPESLYFQALVDESDYALISIGQKVMISLDAFPEKEFSGVVRFIGKEGIKATGGGVKIVVDIDLNNYSEPLVTELNGEADFILSEEETLAIPREYIFNKNDKNYVLVRREGKNRETEVVLGERSGDRIEILSGLSQGEEIVKKEK